METIYSTRTVEFAVATRRVQGAIAPIGRIVDIVRDYAQMATETGRPVQVTVMPWLYDLALYFDTLQQTPDYGWYLASCADYPPAEALPVLEHFALHLA